MGMLCLLAAARRQASGQRLNMLPALVRLLGLAVGRRERGHTHVNEKEGVEMGKLASSEAPIRRLPHGN